MYRCEIQPKKKKIYIYIYIYVCVEINMKDKEFVKVCISSIFLCQMCNHTLIRREIPLFSKVLLFCWTKTVSFEWEEAKLLIVSSSILNAPFDNYKGRGGFAASPGRSNEPPWLGPKKKKIIYSFFFLPLK